MIVKERNLAAASGDDPSTFVPEFVSIQAGSFKMGTPKDDKYWRENEYQHEVALSAFYMSKYEITQREYEAVMGFNPHGYWAPELPVDFVNWFDAVNYCNALSKLTGLAPVYAVHGSTVTWNKGANGYRLPTEAEWEYACRAGTTGARYSTKDEKHLWLDINYSTGVPNSNLGRLSMGGSYPPNPWGLYDMLGNVYEWCWDWWGDDYYQHSPPKDPSGPETGTQKVLRGGSYFLTVDCARSGKRDNSPLNVRWKGNGIRLVHN